MPDNDLNNTVFSIDKVKSIFNDYVEYFLEYNKNVNLISINDESYIYEKHIIDSLAFELFRRKYIKHCNFTLIDIGTGGGFPGCILAQYYKDAEITAIDSVGKKINYLKSAKEHFKINNLYPICQRAEDYAKIKRNFYDVSTSRAVADLRIICEYCLPFVKKDGYFAAYKSLKADEELKNAKNALKVLNAVLIDKLEYKLPLKEDNNRCLLIFKKLSETSPKYPRENGLPKKLPL